MMTRWNRQPLDRLELEQAQIKQAVLETNETVKRMEVIQEQQHRIIELLSARSIEQEAKIKRSFKYTYQASQAESRSE